MHLDFSDEQRLLRDTAREFLSERAPLALCRRVLENEAKPFAEELQGMAGGEMDPEHGFQQGYLKSPSLRVAGGAGEILRNVLAERVLRPRGCR